MSPRPVGDFLANGHGRASLGGEPLVFHCNHYNYFLQSTLLLDDSLGMDTVIRDAATAVVSNCLQHLSPTGDRRALAEALFAELGFGTIDLSQVTLQGGSVVTPTSHYGQALVAANEGKPFSAMQNLFDQGFAAASAAYIHDLPMGSFSARGVSCLSTGAAKGVIAVERCATVRAIAPSPGLGPTSTPVPAIGVHSNIDEPGVLAALATLDFSGNEEGLIPRFGVMLTRHFANFYNRISFEFVRRMAGTGMEAEGRELLVEAGHRCAFNTFGGIMQSGEWAAVVKPQCKQTSDWVHGMVAVVNALGWGTWRVEQLSDRALTIAAYDDYESMGWLGMFGPAPLPVAFLLQGGVAGLMNLVYPGHISTSPTLDQRFYEAIFESPERFLATQDHCRAQGAPATHVSARR